jgi:bacterioferritin-associated ferredoxin
MYVCICNAIHEREFRQMAHCVPGDAEAVYAALGKTPKCRQCLQEANAILIEERAESVEPALAA